MKEGDWPKNYTYSPQTTVCGDGQREGWQGLGGGGGGEMRGVCNSLNNKNNINIQYLVHTVICVGNHLRYY